MDVEPITITLESETSSTFPLALRKILEIPPPVLFDGEDENDKEKLCSGDSLDDMGALGAMGSSAALTPAIWDKTIPYDGETFHLEYMDLEEFLIENGISANAEGGEAKKSPSKEGAKVTVVPAPEALLTTTTAAPVQLLPILELDQCEEEVVSGAAETAPVTDESCASPDPVNPDEVEVNIDFEPDPTDLVLSSVPGGELFNPRKHRFSEEELKPQPMIKKAKKVFVPEEQKDDRYWDRRKKNNVAAKRSRDARRLKENQITVRAAFLERENTALRLEVAELRKENGRFKNVVTNYEAKYGAL